MPNESEQDEVLSEDDDPYKEVMDIVLYEMSNKCSVRQSHLEEILRPVNEDLEHHDDDGGEIYVKDRSDYHAHFKKMRNLMRKSKFGVIHKGPFFQSYESLNRAWDKVRVI